MGSLPFRPEEKTIISGMVWEIFPRVPWTWNPEKHIYFARLTKKDPIGLYIYKIDYGYVASLGITFENPPEENFQPFSFQKICEDRDELRAALIEIREFLRGMAVDLVRKVGPDEAMRNILVHGKE